MSLQTYEDTITNPIPAKPPKERAIAAPKLDTYLDRITVYAPRDTMAAQRYIDAYNVGILGPNATELLELTVHDWGKDKDHQLEWLSLPHLAEHLIMNTSNSYHSWSGGSYKFTTFIDNSSDSTVALSIPDIEIAVPNLLAGYGRYAKPNWDHYGAEPITAKTVDAARRFLSLLPTTLGSPHISPGPDGTVGLEWVFTDKPLRKLYIDVGPGNVWAGYWRRSSGERRVLPSKTIDPKTEAELSALFAELST